MGVGLMARKKKEENTIPKTKKEKLERLKQVMRETNKNYKGNVIKFAKDEEIKERIGFGVKEVDEFTGGGAVCGNFVIIYGGEGVGKSSLVLHQIANAQKNGKICAYLDLEHTFDKNRATKFGVNLDELVLAEGMESAEEAMDIVIKLAKEQAVDYIALDSIHALSPKQERETKSGKEKSMEEEEMALLARKMGKFLRVVAPFIYKSKIAFVLVGQVRIKGIGSFITKEGLTGGMSVHHWSVLTLHLRKGQKVDAPYVYITEDGKRKKQLIGFDCVMKIEKTKVKSAPELSEIHLPFHFNSGFLEEEE